jgi:hypothetical protein
MIDDNALRFLTQAVELVDAHPTQHTADTPAIYAALGWDWDHQQPALSSIVKPLAADGLIVYTTTVGSIAIQPTTRGVLWVKTD